MYASYAVWYEEGAKRYSMCKHTFLGKSPLWVRILEWKIDIKFLERHQIVEKLFYNKSRFF